MLNQVDIYCNLPFSEVLGPFQAVRLVVYPNGEWCLDSPIVQYKCIKVGMLSFPIESSQLIDLARKWLSGEHVLCPGLLDIDGEKLEKELGHIPKNVNIMSGKWIRSVNCKVWPVPSSKLNYDKEQKMCTACLVCNCYINNAFVKKQSLDSGKREQRRNPSSNYPIKYLSPWSKSIRLGNTRKLRSRMGKKIRKLYKKTTVELPQERSSELCKLVEEIEKSSEGRQELQKIVSEGNSLQMRKDVGQAIVLSC